MAARQLIARRMRARRPKLPDAPHAHIKHKNNIQIGNYLYLDLPRYFPMDAPDYLHTQSWRALNTLDISFL